MSNPTSTINEAYDAACGKRKQDFEEAEKSPSKYYGVFPPLPSVKTSMKRWRGDSGYGVNYQLGSGCER